MIRLGAFVIHGNSRSTLGPCLESLLCVTDRVVAVDSCSTDGSAELGRRLGVEQQLLPWQGYGAARARAVEALSDCEWLFFLDSDERLTEPSVATLRAWREGAPSADAYALPRHNWAELDGRRFRYHTDHRRRLVRRQNASWTREMIVHEALKGGRVEPLDAPIEHEFAPTLAGRKQKDERYALLWAIQAQAEGRRGRPAALSRTAHFVRDCLAKGALFRGGERAVALAWTVSRYHFLKYRFLKELRAGAHPKLVEAYREDRLVELFEQVAKLPPLLGQGGRSLS